MNEKKKSKKKDGWGDLVRTIAIGGAIALLFRSLLFEPFNIPSGSMIPTLRVGDYLFVSKFSYGYSRYSFPLGLIPFEGRIMADQPERGDVIVFRQPGNESISFIKRLVGLPGDMISVKQGILNINDQPVTRLAVAEGTTSDGLRVMRYVEFDEVFPDGGTHRIRERTDRGPYDNYGPVEVPEGHYFMMGDNRDASNDSRAPSVGFVPAQNLIGKAQFLFFSHDSSARLWEIWRWPFAIRYSRIGDGIT